MAMKMETKTRSNDARRRATIDRDTMLVHFQAW